MSQEYIFGVTPDAPVITNENGGKQSASPYAFELLPPHALFEAAAVAKHGADKYGESFGNRNYTKIDSKSHLNHALQHIYAYLAGDTSDDHLSHALVRMMFAVDMDHREKMPKPDYENATIIGGDGIRFTTATTPDPISYSSTDGKHYQGVTLT